MSKTKLLLDVVKDLESLAGSIKAMAEAAEGGEPVAVKKLPKKITLEDVRAVLAEKSHDGFTTEVRGLLEKHGASKLSEVEPKKYAALLADAEGLK